MKVEDMAKFLPDDWSPMDVTTRKYEIIPVPVHTIEYSRVALKFQSEYRSQPGPIFRIQNPLLFTKFYMKCMEYESRGQYEIVTLYHDTVQSNVESIATYNIDWRYGERFKYGPGVYFSRSRFKAERRSNTELGPFRAMFLVNVIVGKHQIAKPGEFLPDLGYDTIISSDGETVVKYFDHEYYPSYVQNYCAY